VHSIESGHEGIECGFGGRLGELELIETVGRRSDRFVQPFMYHLNVLLVLQLVLASLVMDQPHRIHLPWLAQTQK
jgi:hypothetical protein